MEAKKINASELPAKITILNETDKLETFSLIGFSSKKALGVGEEVNIKATTSTEWLYYFNISNDLGLTFSSEKLPSEGGGSVYDLNYDAETNTLTLVKDGVIEKTLPLTGDGGTIIRIAGAIQDEVNFTGNPEDRLSSIENDQYFSTFTEKWNRPDIWYDKAKFKETFDIFMTLFAEDHAMMEAVYQMSTSTGFKQFMQAAGDDARWANLMLVSDTDMHTSIFQPLREISTGNPEFLYQLRDLSMQPEWNEFIQQFSEFWNWYKQQTM